jgi:crotonobetainyl-CoA:carnitine CoA-transferase CaiB-like acyl-CoA transferase
MSETPWRVQRPAPTLGQHTGEVLADIGITREELARLFSAGVAA